MINKGTEQIKEKSCNYKIVIVFALLIALLTVISSTIIFWLNWDISIDTSNVQTQLEYGETLNMPTATVNGKLFFKKGFVIPVTSTCNTDMSKIGEHRIYYNAKWFVYEKTTYEDVLVVDIKAPTITVVKTEDNYIVEAHDNYDGDLTDKVNEFVSEDNILYYVEDSSGNFCMVEAEKNEDTKPIISLAGEKHITIKVGNKYIDPGYTADDKEDGNITDKVIVCGHLNENEIGTYELIYVVSDSAGHVATESRIVHVVNEYVNTENNKTIYLTFDDGPSIYTDELLKVLKKYKVQATFFVVGNTGCTSKIKNIVQDGHSIGIHSTTHSFKNIYSSVDVFVDDLLNMQGLIEEYSGVKTYLMRFPGGSSNTISKYYSEGIMTELTTVVEDLGFVYFDWNVDSGDAGGITDKDVVFQNIIKGVKSQPKYSIVLQHDIKKFSVEAVEDVIKWGIENGYQFKALDMQSPTAHHKVMN